MGAGYPQWRSIDAPPSEPCQHMSTEFRFKSAGNCGVQLRKQCIACGAAVGAAVSQQGRDLSRIPAWDEVAHARYLQEESQRRENWAAEKNQAFWEWYNGYLISDEWKARRALVMKRAEGWCEGCREQSATMVHHLSYAHVGDEFLWELVAICSGCHDRAHAK